MARASWCGNFFVRSATMDSDSGEIFISYKSERRRAAEHLAETLRRYGYTVWFDYQLVKGRDFARQIDARIRAAKALVVLWCTRSVQSEWVGEEVDLAKARGILIPAKIEDCDLPVGDRRKDYIDLIHWDGSPRSHQLDGLLAAIAAMVGREPAPHFRALQEYDAIWRRFGALPLKAFTLETPLEASQGARPLPEPSAPAFPPPVPSVVRRSTLEERYRAEGRVQVDCPPEPVRGAPDGWFLPGAGKTEWFQDIAGGPEMVVVPQGSFTMGSPEDEPGRFSVEGPQHEVRIPQDFAVGRHAVTRGQFAAFVKATGHKADGAYVWKGDKWEHDAKASWRNPGFAQDDSHPVVCVNWDDAKAYTAWLAQATGKPYRLLSEAEWEYCCRARTATPFWWGSAITPAQANYDGNYVYAGGGSKGEWRNGTVPVGSLAPNAWGLYQVHGNVWEWCEDIWHDNYEGAPPTDGSPWLQGGDASRRVVRGGAWGDGPWVLRSACRIRDSSVLRIGSRGFRLARTL
jgi:formylglycine-generating enzyme required for sulfatase activity